MPVTKKMLLPAGITNRQRIRYYELAKSKCEQSGWVIKDYHNGGMTGSSYLMIEKELLDIHEKTPKLSTPIWQKIIISVLILVVISALIPPSPPKLPLSKPYELISQKDFSTDSRQRMECAVISQASTFEERAQTVMKAAIDLQKKTGADVVSVWQEINPSFAGKGLLLAAARYAPDGKGFSGDQNWKWQVESTSETPDQLAIETAKLWYSHRESFLKKNYVLDEDRLKDFISKKIHVPVDRINLPVYLLQAYPVQMQ